MKKNNILLLVFLMIFSLANAQMDKTVQLCDKYLLPPFISDGQDYRTILNNDQIAEFHMTLYGGATYRIIACSGDKEGALSFSVYDVEKNLLFTNKDHKDTPYWDFKISHTVDIIVEAELKNQKENSGFVFISLAFKQE